LLGTGVRISEALGLTWDCVDFDNDIISIRNIIVESKGVPRFQDYTKTEDSLRDIPMSNKIKEILFKIKNERSEYNILNLVFVSKMNKILYKVKIREILKRICKKIEIKEITPHVLRHTFATRMLETGVNIKVLSEILGHKNINITLDIYAHVLPSTKKETMKNIDEFI
jgi:integrase